MACSFKGNNNSNEKILARKSKEILYAQSNKHRALENLCQIASPEKYQTLLAEPAKMEHSVRAIAARNLQRCP